MTTPKNTTPIFNSENDLPIMFPLRYLSHTSARLVNISSASAVITKPSGTSDTKLR